MAQHIPIKFFKQKRFRIIEENIRKDIKRGHPKYSFKYQYEENLSNFYKANDAEEVCLCGRYIGKGFIHGSERASFEIHFDKKDRNINEIYLVA